MKDERIKQYKNGSKGKNPGQAKKKKKSRWGRDLKKKFW
jgi:hypothetical protein